jgi:ABC-type uncharacterized transport system permease subunit
VQEFGPIITLDQLKPVASPLPLSYTHFRFLISSLAGRGWIAIAIVIFGAWRPWSILGASLFFAFYDSFQRQIQNTGFALIPYQFILILPYVIAILVLLINRKRPGAPLALGSPYIRELITRKSSASITSSLLEI